ncbi:MAG: TonB-dependent receptor, partial [Thermodesulfobacteriota bacterium]
AMAANAKAGGIELRMGSGFRVDRLDWNIAGNLDGANPNILSELTWSGLDIVELTLEARRTINRVYLRGSVDYGFIFSGSNQDSDYNGDNRTLEYSRSDNNASDGSVWDVSLGVGYTRWVLRAARGRLRVIPLLGYSFHKQNLTITDGFQTIPATGSFPGLDSSYNALWMGPWAGFDLDYKADRLKLFGAFELHAAYYRATANWNLRTDFMHPKSFEHTANGLGVVLSLGADYGLSRDLSLVAAVSHQDWHTFEGTDRTFFSDGTASDTQLNEVNWSSDDVTLAIEFRF